MRRWRGRGWWKWPSAGSQAWRHPSAAVWERFLERRCHASRNSHWNIKICCRTIDLRIWDSIFMTNDAHETKSKTSSWHCVLEIKRKCHHHNHSTRSDTMQNFPAHRRNKVEPNLQLYKGAKLLVVGASNYISGASLCKSSWWLNLGPIWKIWVNIEYTQNHGNSPD